MPQETTDQDGFKQLEQMLGQVEQHGLSSLPSDDLLEFGHQYRRVLSALSKARSQGVNDARIAYLNQLASRAYAHIYVAEPKGWPSVRRFFTEEFPQTFRRNLLFIFISFAVCVGAALFAYAQVQRDPGKADVVLGPGAGQMADMIAQRHTGGLNWMPEEMRPIMSSYIMQNNIRVCIMSFATGILAGVGTLYFLFYNGLMLGVIGAVVNSRDLSVVLSFWGFVAPHGVIELLAIFIAAGAGLMLGWAVLNPGEYTRGDALKLAGREAFKLMLGVAAMLVVAGLIEGFFSPSMVPEEFKLTVAAMIAALEIMYFGMAGREVRRQVKCEVRSAE
jgi:uncharacterized membrane protein SpoIIM required for sporulation